MRVPANPTGLCECGCGELTRRASKGDGTFKRGEHRRFLPGHHGINHGPRYRVDENGCWVWLRAHTACGYGSAWDKAAQRMRGAHIVEWESVNGPVPEGLELDHLCRNRGCCNPEHVEPVTHIENIRRGARAKLSRADVIAIRLEPTTPLRVLAERYGVGEGAIQGVRYWRSWKDVVPPDEADLPWPPEQDAAA